MNNEFNNFSKTASELNNFNKNKTDKFNNNHLGIKEAANINKHNLVRNKNSDLPKEFLLEENYFYNDDKHSFDLRNKNLSNTASNFNSKNNDKKSSSIKFRGIQQH